MLDSGSRHPCTDPHNPNLDISGGCHLYSDVILGVTCGIDMELCHFYTVPCRTRICVVTNLMVSTFISTIHNLVTSWWAPPGAVLAKVTNPVSGMSGSGHLWYCVLYIFMFRHVRLFVTRSRIGVQVRCRIPRCEFLCHTINPITLMNLIVPRSTLSRTGRPGTTICLVLP